MQLFTFFLIIVGIGLVIIRECTDLTSDLNTVSFVIGVTMLIIGFIMIFILIYESNTIPTALDVYRGNTTLQITYQDNIPIDSIVVFKNK